jgi:Flp pilus assembly protein TadG
MKRRVLILVLLLAVVPSAANAEQDARRRVFDIRTSQEGESQGSGAKTTTYTWTRSTNPDTWQDIPVDAGATLEFPTPSRHQTGYYAVTAAVPGSAPMVSDPVFIKVTPDPSLPVGTFAGGLLFALAALGGHCALKRNRR